MPTSFRNMVEINTHIYRPGNNINTVPKNINLDTQWLLQPFLYILSVVIAMLNQWIHI